MKIAVPNASIVWKLIELARSGILSPWLLIHRPQIRVKLINKTDMIDMTSTAVFTVFSPLSIVYEATATKSLQEALKTTGSKSLL